MIFASNVVGIITAFCSVILALTGLVAAIKGLVPLVRRTKDLQNAVSLVKQDVRAVHVIVNQQRSDMLHYQRTLIQALARAGVAVPADETATPPEAHEES